MCVWRQNDAFAKWRLHFYSFQFHMFAFKRNHHQAKDVAVSNFLFSCHFACDISKDRTKQTKFQINFVFVFCVLLCSIFYFILSFSFIRSAEIVSVFFFFFLGRKMLLDVFFVHPIDKRMIVMNLKFILQIS